MFLALKMLSCSEAMSEVREVFLALKMLSCSEAMSEVREVFLALKMLSCFKNNCAYSLALASEHTYSLSYPGE